jgi:hypothetical protein
VDMPMKKQNSLWMRYLPSTGYFAFCLTMTKPVAFALIKWYL